MVTASDGAAGLERARTQKPDLVILDIMLPKLSGLEVCKTLRGEGFEAPDHHADRPRPGDRQGGGPGAGRRRLRDQAVLDPRAAGPRARDPAAHRGRRKRGWRATASPTSSWTSRSYGATKGGAPLELSPREFELLRYLIERKGETVSRDRLLEDVWGYESYPSTRTVDTHIAKLRAKIGDSGSRAALHPDDPRRGLQVRRPVVSVRRRGTAKPRTAPRRAGTPAPAQRPGRWSWAGPPAPRSRRPLRGPRSTFARSPASGRPRAARRRAFDLAARGRSARRCVAAARGARGPRGRRDAAAGAGRGAGAPRRA